MEMERPIEFKNLFENKSANILAFKTKKGEGPFLMSTSWNMPVSYSPKLVGVCVGEKRHSSTLLAEIDMFSLIVPGQKMQSLVTALGCVSQRHISVPKSEKFKVKFINDDLAIDGCLGYAKFKRYRIEKFGTHFFLIGELIKSACFDDEETLFEKMVYSIGGQNRLFNWGEKL